MDMPRRDAAARNDNNRTVNSNRRPDTYATNTPRDNNRSRRPSHSMLIDGRPLRLPSSQQPSPANNNPSTSSPSSATSSRSGRRPASLARIPSEDIAATLETSARPSAYPSAPAASSSGHNGGRYAVQGELAGRPPHNASPSSRHHGQSAPTRAYDGGGGIPQQGHPANTHTPQHRNQQPGGGSAAADPYSNPYWSMYPGFNPNRKRR